jgi:hypothetical protein
VNYLKRPDPPESHCTVMRRSVRRHFLQFTQSRRPVAQDVTGWPHAGFPLRSQCHFNFGFRMSRDSRFIAPQVYHDPHTFVGLPARICWRSSGRLWLQKRKGPIGVEP